MYGTEDEDDVYGTEEEDDVYGTEEELTCMEQRTTMSMEQRSS